MLQRWGRAFYSDYWKMICQTGSDFYSLASGDRVFELLELQERPTLTPVQKRSSFSTSISLCLSISASWLSLSFSSFHLFQSSLFKTTFSNSFPFDDTAPYLIRLSTSRSSSFFLSVSPNHFISITLRKLLIFRTSYELIYSRLLWSRTVESVALISLFISLSVFFSYQYLFITLYQ